MLEKTHPDYKAYKRYYGAWFTAASVHSSKIHSILLWTQVAFNSACFAYTATLIWGNKIECAQTIQFNFMMWSSLLMNMSLRYNNHRLEAIWSLLGSKRFNYGVDSEAEHYAEQERQKRKHAGLRNARYFAFFCIFGAAFQGGFRVIWVHLVGSQKKVLAKRIPGICYRLPSPYWFPVDPCKNIFAFVVYAIFKYNVIFFIFVTYFTMISSTIVLSEDIFTEFEILQYSMRTIVQRAERRHEKHKTSGKYRKDFNLILKETVAITVDHHNHVLELVNHLKETLRLPILFLLLESIFRLCFASLVLTMKSVPVVVNITNICLALTTVIQIGLVSNFSQKFGDHNSEVGKDLYRCGWISNVKIMKTTMLMVQARSQRQLALTAGGFGHVKLETFLAVLQTAFSYYNVLSAMSGE